MNIFYKTYSDFINLFFPNICHVCGQKLYQGEKIICMHCIYDMPKTNFHKETPNELMKIFWGRFPLQKATALLYFKKGSKYRKLIHKLKYQKKPEIGIYLGNLLSENLEEWTNDIDYIIPVPLHPKKKKIRGYNQSEQFAIGISEILNIKVDTKTLIRSKFTETQTKKGRFERWKNVGTVFEITNTEMLKDKHVLLVDDVITTGATIEGSAQALLGISGLKISIASIGIVYN